MDDFGIEKGLGMGFNIIHQSTDKILRFTAAGGDKDVITPPDMAENSLFLDEFFGVNFFPVVQRATCAVFNTHQDYPCCEIWITIC